MKRFVWFLMIFAILTFNAYSFDYNPECDVPVGKGVFLNSFYTNISYDESHPEFDKVHSTGGWTIGLVFDGFDPDIRNVRIAGGGAIISKATGFDVSAVGKERSSYTITIGHEPQVADVYRIRAWTKNGTPVRFIRDNRYFEYLVERPKKDLELVLSIPITNMVLDTATNEIVITADVPYDPRAFLIRLNVLEGDNKVDASYTFIPVFGKTTFTIPGNWSKYEASLIYILKDTNYKLRGVTRFMLP